MAFPLDHILTGAPAYGPRKGTEGVVWHTTEGTDASRTSAINTARWQATPGTTTGSYNWIIYDGGLLLTVPYLEASGGVNPGSISWAPGRYPFLKQNLSPAAYADPNAYLLNVSFSGKTSVFRAGGMPQNMIDTAVALTKWVEAQGWAKKPLVHCGHMNWQTNRSDPSQVVLDRIAAVYRGEEEPMTSLKGAEFIANRRAIVGAGASIRSAPAFDRTNYDGNVIGRVGSTESAAPAVAWITGTNLTLSDGTVYDARTRWLALLGRSYGVGFIHERDVVRLEPIESSGYSAEDLTAARTAGHAEGIKVGFVDAKTKAAVAVQGIRP